jgi:hypothetical protein
MRPASVPESARASHCREGQGQCGHRAGDLAKALGVPKSAVSVEKGETQRIKTVRISADASIAAAMERLSLEKR